jgi:hypothetical protein
LGEKVGMAIKQAQTLGRIRMAPGTASAWERIYCDLSSERPGLLGAVIGRAEAQVIRLALIYAVLDNQPLIGLAHLQAALAVWSYCEESTAQIFGDLLGDSVADTILSALRTAGSAGMSRTGISGLFSRHVPSARISIALNLLQRLAVAKPCITLSGRHKLETWHFEGGK